MIIKYPNSRGKRILKRCETCKIEFETLQIKVNAGGEKYCSVVCYQNFRSENKKNRDELFDNKMYQKKYKYGLEKETYIELLEKQENKCAICLKEFKSTGRYDSPCVDHCHISNKVRGLLCHACNKSLGGFEDNIEYLNNAIEYLKSQLHS